MAASTAALNELASAAELPARSHSQDVSHRHAIKASEVSVEGHTLQCSFMHRGEGCKVYEDLRTRDGDITFISATGIARVMPKTAEATFAEEGPQYLGLDLKDIGMSPRDLLADMLLAHGDPKEDDERRSDQLQAALIKSIDANTKGEIKPPYIGPLPGTTLTFLESLEREHPSEQQWPHRCYAELLQPGVLPAEQENRIIDCMQAYVATTLGVVANVERPHPNGRDILGFISYGYAQALLRLDRIEEYILFLYSHRYHDHSRGSWTAGEVSGITGDGALFCIPAQQTIPLLVRWMLVFEDPDEETLYFGRAIPRDWIASGKMIRINQAPTRWGRVDFQLVHDKEHRILANIVLPDQGELPKMLHVSFRVPSGSTVASMTVNGRTIAPAGRFKDAAVFAAHGERHYQVIAGVS
jgi:hypothetical protein